jgi:Cytochrome c7 and related cytochrome c
MKNVLRIAVIVIITAAGAAVMLMTASAQKKRNEFYHDTAAHKKLNCASCHKNPTPNSEAVRGYPDVADYPGHASCISCHRADFFSGNRPAICTICHTNPGPANGKRFAFPQRSRPHEFTTIFPHDVHQDIIALNVTPATGPPNSRRVGGATTDALFVRASFPMAAPNTHLGALAYARATDTDDPAPTFNNCAICHQTASELPKYAAINLPNGKALSPAVGENFKPEAGFFKDSPMGHQTCFTCHYQGQKPVRTDCAGCHSASERYKDTGVTERYSLKFDHQSANHVNKDCTTCHVRITQTKDLAAMKGADVPFVTCASCHAAQLKEETDKRAGAATFQCAYCHSPEVGRFEIPPSHRNR